MARVQQSTPDLPAYETSRVTSFVGDRRGLVTIAKQSERNASASHTARWANGFASGFLVGRPHPLEDRDFVATRNSWGDGHVRDKKRE